ncbi:CRISPR system precrRNA processing endoribonuclease RAMP protein Cas6 [Salinarimonas sp. NSM]|uniref:CRISPR system precrRNA processing endoribonuclease RAMP protein Cas6 n=1 Tax=Salinarimonas sp. NSM TaxID=3458003 RepID=UPI00403635EC
MHAPAQPPNTAPSVDPDALLALWQHEEIRVVAARPRGLEDHPDLPVRIRGAFGRALADRPPPRRADPFGRPRAFDTLFGEGQAPRPFVIDVDVRGDVLIVDLRLFGAARIHADDAREALVEALAGGVALKPRGMRVPFAPLDCLMRRASPPWPAPAAREAHVRFLTPLVIRSGGRLSAAPDALLVACVERVNGLAAWSGLAPTFDRAAARIAAARLSVEALETIPVRMTRWSQRGGDTPIPVSGFLGAVRIHGPLGPFAPYLLLARDTHIGSHAAIGFGRVEVALG